MEFMKTMRMTRDNMDNRNKAYATLHEFTSLCTLALTCRKYCIRHPSIGALGRKVLIPRRDNLRFTMDTYFKHCASHMVRQTPS